MSHLTMYYVLWNFSHDKLYMYITYKLSLLSAACYSVVLILTSLCCRVFCSFLFFLTLQSMLRHLLLHIYLGGALVQLDALDKFYEAELLIQWSIRLVDSKYLMILVTFIPCGCKETMARCPCGLVSNTKEQFRIITLKTELHGFI